jgi:hypothetical protein
MALTFLHTYRYLLTGLLMPATSERKYQSHPAVPPGRLIELAFALAVWGRWFELCELLWGVEPHYIPWLRAVGVAGLSPPPLAPGV